MHGDTGRGTGMGHARGSRLSCFLASTALLGGALVGCSASPASESPTGSTPPAVTSSSADELAVLQQFAALPAAEQQAQLQALTESMDRELMTMSGLEEELGGAAKADAAYAALSAQVRLFAQGIVDTPDFGRFGASVAAEDAPTMGGMMFGNFMVGGLIQDAAVDVAKDVAPGTSKGPESEGLGNAPSGGKGSLSAEGDLAKSSLGVEGEFTVDGITGKLKTVVTVSPCPDAKGQFTSKTTMTASVTSAKGSTGSNLTIEMEIKGQVDDDAQLVSYDTDTRTQSAKFENGKGQYVDQTVGWTVAGKDWSNYRGKVNRTGGNATQEFAVDQGKWSTFTAMMMQDKAVEAAKKGWQSGRCVKLEPTTQPGKRTGLKPSASLTITAAPRSKIDGGPVGGTVTAQLNGDTSVDPAGSKVKADASFAYVGPGEKDKSATVALEARSKRGVAKADVVFDTKSKGYVASGGGTGMSVSGSVPDLAAPFTLQGQGTGFTVSFDYVPTSADGRSGTLTYSGSGGGVTMKGTGTYSIVGDEGGVLTMTVNNQGCATPGGCRSNVETITLTPAT
jgi:hypothetical protein